MENNFDIDSVRDQFPILRREINNYPLVYLDSAASSQKPQFVIDAISQVYSTSYANVHRGLHTLANEATEAMEEGRKTVANFIGSPKSEQVIFTKGGTEAINLVASSFVEPMIKPGDEIIVSIMDHHSNIVPWYFLQERKGAVLRWADIDDDGNLNLEHFYSLFNKKTKFVAITQMSNVLGTINPIEEITSFCNQKGIPILVDGCQGTVHNRVDVAKLGVDFFVCTGHKLYGPSGIGLLYGKEELLANMRPYQGGGEMIDRVSIEEITYAEIPYRFEAGTPPIVEAIGLGKAIKWLLDLDFEKVRQHENSLLEHLTTELRKINDVKIYGEAKNKGAIVSFAMGNIHAHDTAALLDKYAIAVRAGAHCAEPLMRRFGVKSTCRASFGVYNNHKDIEALLDGLKKVKSFF